MIQKHHYRVSEKTLRTWFEVTVHHPEEDNPEWLVESPQLRVVVKWDGCSHIWINELSVGKEIKEDTTYIHTDALDDLIAVLQEVKRRAEEHFGCPYEDLG